MKYSVEQYAEGLSVALKGASSQDEYRRILDRFVAVLKQDGILAQLPEIIKRFESISSRSQEAAEVECTLARAGELSEEESRKIKNLAGENSRITYKVDPGLIGGLVVRVGDLLIDGSVKKDLSDLRNTLAK